MSRDMTAAQFEAALKRNGMERTGFMGYVCVHRSGKSSSHVYPGNAGPNRRAQLAYLLREQARNQAEHAKAEKAKATPATAVHST